MNNFKILVDGSNVAFFQRNKNKKAKVKNLEILLNFLENIENRFCIKNQILIDASLLHKIDDRKKIDEMIQIGKIIQCPSGIKADDFIINYALNHPKGTIIISNDCFKEYNVRNIILLKFAIIFEEFLTIPKIKNIISLTNNKIREESKITEPS